MAVASQTKTPLHTPPETRKWGILFWAALGVCLAGTALVMVLPDSRETAFAMHALLVERVHAGVETHLPAALRPFVRESLSLLLSPWLYLGVFLVTLAEKWIPADRRTSVFSRGFIQDFVAWFLLNAMLSSAISIGCLALLDYLYETYLSTWRLSDSAAFAIPLWMRVIAAIVISDFLKWVYHLLSHKVKVLWFFHSIHHSQKELNLFTDLRFHAVEFLWLAPILYTPLYLLNLDFELAAWIVLLMQWYTHVYHANLRTDYGPLRYLFVTPQSHRIHHSVEERHMDKNFGSLFCVWDRLFSTHWEGHEEYPATGIRDETFPWEESVGGLHILGNYFAQTLYPFRCLWRMLRGRS